LLNWDAGGLVIRMSSIVWSLFPFARRIRLLPSDPIFPHLGFIRPFITCNAMGFDLIRIYRCYAVACVMDGLVPCLIVRRRQIIVLRATRTVNRRQFQLVIRRVCN